MARRIEAEHVISQKRAGSQSLVAQRFSAIFDTHPEPAKRADMAEDFYFQSKYGTTFKEVAGTSTAFPIAYAFDWPVGPPSEGVALDREQLSENNWYVSVKFREQYNGKAPHAGVDISQPGDSDLGQPVFAIADGVVKAIRQPTNEGDAPCRSDPWNGIVLIEYHPQGGSAVYSQSAHLRNLKVHEGDPVSIHQQIGEIGPKPYGSTGVHLHFEMRTNADIGISEDPYRYDNPGYIDPIDFIKNHRHLGTPPPVPSQVPIIREQFHIGDDRSQTEMIKDATFSFYRADATLKMWIKGSPFKDPIIWINRHEVGRVVTTDDKWHRFTFHVPAQYLNNGGNLLHMESFIPDRWHTFDDCEVKDVWIVRD
jgi:murein DD-endopeptidase MepM/ murein hydrolase activator NlpD